jgi:phospholipase/lecithinase/hemolysin
MAVSIPDGSASPEPQDSAVEALHRLTDEIDRSLVELQHARRQAETLLRARHSGYNWREVVGGEVKPMVLEKVSGVLGALSTVGGTWRREQVKALASEGVSINRIAALFGVTRQRISALLRERDV